MPKMTDKLEEKADILAGNVSGWETSTLERIGKRIGKRGRMTIADVKAVNNIADVKQDMEAITKELARVTGMNIAEVQKMYAEAIAEQHEANRKLYDYRGKKFVPFAENRELQALVRAYAKTTGGTMINLAKTSGLCIMDKYGKPIGLQQYYTDTLDKAVMQVSSGAADFHTAMRDVIRELGGSGVRVDYGGGITRRLETVVRQNLLWGAKQASNEYNEMIGAELGCDGIEVDWHSCPRPSHEFMQGRQFVLGKSRTVNGVRFESADEALERLQDYGCLHFKTPIICGISEPTYSTEQLKELNKRNRRTFEINGKEVSAYEASQMMRRLESGVRNEKNIRDLARASGDALQVRRSNARIAAYKAKYEEISEITGIAQDKRRMAVTKGKNNVNVLQNSGESGIIKAEIEMFSKKYSETEENRIPISKKRFDELTIEAKKMGANVIQCNFGDEIFEHLQKNDASASCIGNTLLFRPDATVSEVFEETFHFKQNISKINDDKPVMLRKILNEIEAKEYILNNANKYGVPRTEINEIKVHLEKYKQDLKKYYEGE